MDIVAESLSANILKARNVTVRGQDILAWFESKLSASVSFVGVFADLADAPRRNGAIAIVGSKDYVYRGQEDDGEWHEFGDEGQIGVLTQAVAELSNSLSGYQPSGDYALKTDIPSASAISSEIHLSDYSLTSHSHDGTYLKEIPDDYKTYDQTKSSLSADGYALASDISDLSAIRQDVANLGAVSSEYRLTAEAGSMAYENAGDYLTEETDPVFQGLSGQFLTAHQSLSGYYQRSETSSSAEISAALSDIKVPPDFSTALSGKSYYYGMDFAGVLSALRDVLSAMGGRIQSEPL